MEADTPGARRSDRVELELAIQVSGTDGQGRGFMEDTRTLVVSRHGAKIVLMRQLVPEQEINIRCQKTARECGARIVGQIGGDDQGFHYGIEILDPQLNLWGIEFPPLANSEEALGRVLLECVRCHSQELAYLDGFELEVLEANDYLSRKCKRCVDSTLWKKGKGEPEPPPPPPAAKPPAQKPAAPEKPAAAPAPPVRSENVRQHARLDLRVEACIRDEKLGEEIVSTENASQGGFRFRSKKQYSIGAVLNVAVPHTEGAANVFSQARIVYGQEVEGEDAYIYGVKYLSVHKGWPVD